MNFFIKSLLLWGYLIASVFINNAEALSVEKIVGGKLTPPKELGYNAFVKIGPQGGCSGVIIAKKIVITAAHCLYDGKGELRSASVRVVAGIRDLADRADPQRVEVKVTKFYVFKAFFDETKNLMQSRSTEFKDIAVLKLEHSLKIENNPFIRALRLPEDGSTYDGEKVMVSGFGVNEIKYENFVSTPVCDGKLRQLPAVVSYNHNCLDTYFQGMTLKNPEQFLCARMNQYSMSKISSTCKGDSGGPLVYKNEVLVGIVSLGSPYCDSTETMFIKIASFKDFINKVQQKKFDKTMHCEPLHSMKDCTIQ